MHDASHEERCLLQGSGAEGCAECRAFLAAMSAASDSARRAALAPPSWLDARVLGRTAPRRASQPRWSWLGASLAAGIAALALAILPSLSRKPNLSWANDIETDLARMDSELADLSDEVTVNAEAVELYRDLDRLERMAQRLEQQRL
jgi:hypothetical protein